MLVGSAACRFYVGVGGAEIATTRRDLGRNGSLIEPLATPRCSA
jgi:hypothetical protein